MGWSYQRRRREPDRWRDLCKLKLEGRTMEDVEELGVKGLDPGLC